jgi:hypothetical protein
MALDAFVVTNSFSQGRSCLDTDNTRVSPSQDVPISWLGGKDGWGCPLVIWRHGRFTLPGSRSDDGSRR